MERVAHAHVRDGLLHVGARKAGVGGRAKADFIAGVEALHDLKQLPLENGCFNEGILLCLL